MAKLGEICAFQSGGTPSKNKPEYFGGEIPWISTTALNGDKINEADAVTWITPKAIRESAAKIVPANSIMVGTRVGIGKVAINTVEMSTSQDVISLIGIDKDKWYKPYLCKLLLSKKDYFNSQARGATIKGIKIDVVANIDVPEIDYATQRKVAATLNKIDTLIVLRKQQLEKLDELVKARFVEMFGERSSIRPQKLKEVTRRVKVGFVGTCEKYYTDNTGVPMLRTTNITSHGIDLKDLKYVTRTFHEKNLKSRVHKGDLLIARHGSNGQANVYCGDEAQCLNAIIIEPDHNITNPIFLENLINSRSVKRQIEKELVGSTQHVLNTTTLANVEVKIPAIKEQQVFAAFVERVDQQKQTVQQSLEKLELMKKALMQEYFG
jgi:type I restriction enzyme S subunit